MKKAWAYLLVFTTVFIGCFDKDDEGAFTPKPMGYMRISLPAKTYTTYQSNCPFTFSYPTLATISPDSSRLAEPCWINIAYPAFNAQLYLSYKGDAANMKQYLDESRKMAFKHTVKANNITEQNYNNPANRVFSTIYEISGNAATNLQFVATDSTKHFLRGVLYYNVAPNADSTAPVTAYITADVKRLLETLEWK